MKTIRCLFLIFILIFFTYYDLPLSFFQQEEWHNLVFQKEFILFGLNFSAYAWLSILLHLANTFLVFYLAWLFFQRELLALISALMFGLNSFSHQTVSWVATSINTQGACVFLLLSLIFLAKQQPAFSILALALSLGFKETSTFLFIFLPIFWLIFAKKRKMFSLKRLLIPLFIFGLFYFSLRFFLLLNTPSFSAEQAKALTQPPRVVYLYRLVSLPLRAIPQSLISARQILNWAEDWVRLAHSRFFVGSDGTVNPYVLETVVFDLVCFLLTVIFFLGIYFFYFYRHQKKNQRLTTNLIFSLTLILASAFPLIFIPGKAGYSSIIEPRHLYVTGIGSSLFLTLTIFVVSERLASRVGKSLRLKKKFLFLGFLSAFSILLLFVHFKNIRQDMEQQIINSQLRKSILNQVKASYPDLPERVVFYTKSDCSDYGFRDDEMILPFQAGFRQILLVWYSKSEKFPPCFYQDVFLDEITSQGYRFCQKRGFGYFRDFNQLVAVVKKENLPMESVYGFEWRCEERKLFDITDLVRKDIAKF